METVGVGQDELEIARLAHSTLVVMAPGMGDEVQAIKAGILEIADLFVVNKADREGADATVRDLEMMVGMSHELLHAGSLSSGTGRRASGLLAAARRAAARASAATGSVTGSSSSTSRVRSTRADGIQIGIPVPIRRSCW